MDFKDREQHILYNRCLQAFRAGDAQAARENLMSKKEAYQALRGPLGLSIEQVSTLLSQQGVSPAEIALMVKTGSTSRAAWQAAGMREGEISARADDLLKKVLSEEDWDPNDNIRPEQRWEPVFPEHQKAGYRTDVKPNFRDVLKQAIIRKIAELKADGIVNMGWDNFLQVLRIPPGGPVGTNALYYVRQTIQEIVNELGPQAKRFFIAK